MTALDKAKELQDRTKQFALRVVRKMRKLMTEANELLAIFSASLRTAKGNRQ